MASAYVPSESDEEFAEEDAYDSYSLSDNSSNEDSDTQLPVGEPCKYYNKYGTCRSGRNCQYLHVCKYYLRGDCRYGSCCKLNHSVGGSPSSGGAMRRSASTGEGQREPKLTDGRPYQWQLNDGNNWKDIENDHILEAQYSLPHTKGIKIYNTPYGAVSIDFKRLKVHGKHLRVRRLDDGNTVWVWYCTLGRKWIKYGDKDSKGVVSPVKSSDIEKEYQSNPVSSYTFSIGPETFEIRFREMQQVGQKGKKKVARRPLFQPQQAAAMGVSGLTSSLPNLSMGTTPQWQFEGKGGTWYSYKKRGGSSSECSITSDDIERRYQQDRNASITFTVKGQSYKLDLAAMTQTQVGTRRSRKVRRVLV